MPIGNPYYQQILQALQRQNYQPPPEAEQPMQLPQAPQLQPMPQAPSAMGTPGMGQMQAMTKETAKKGGGQASAPASGDMQQRLFGFQPNQFPTQSFGY